MYAAFLEAVKRFWATEKTCKCHSRSVLMTQFDTRLFTAVLQRRRGHVSVFVALFTIHREAAKVRHVIWKRTSVKTPKSICVKKCEGGARSVTVITWRPCEGELGAWQTYREAVARVWTQSKHRHVLRATHQRPCRLVDVICPPET